MISATTAVFIHACEGVASIGSLALVWRRDALLCVAPSWEVQYVMLSCSMVSLLAACPSCWARLLGRQVRSWEVLMVAGGTGTLLYPDAPPCWACWLFSTGGASLTLSLRERMEVGAFPAELDCRSLLLQRSLRRRWDVEVKYSFGATKLRGKPLGEGAGPGEREGQLYSLCLFRVLRLPL